MPLTSADFAAIWLTLQLASLTTVLLLLIGTPILSREGRRLGTDIAAFRLEKLAGRLDALVFASAPESLMVQMLLQTPGV